MVQGISSHPELGKPDYELALRQHSAYKATLRLCGLELRELDCDERYPDSCFVEDVAVCTKAFAMLARPGAPSRAGETEGMAALLAEYWREVESIKAPGSLEGGDVMMVGDHFYIGLSARTNREGAGQFMAALERHGLSGSLIEMPELLHLKTGLAWLEDGTLLTTREFLDHPAFKAFRKIVVPEHEAYAANCIRVNDRVIMPSGYPETEGKIRDSGFAVSLVDSSEYRKLDGGLSCLSLRF